MAQGNFDIDRLAAYLHLTPPQVSRMAERGRLPGRKIAGEWQFSPAEIHHWLEERIGVSDEGELLEVEGVLRRNEVESSEAQPRVIDLLRAEAIEIPLMAKTRNSVILSMVDRAAATGLLWDPEKMVDAVRAREELHPTAMENGVALLHPRRPMTTILAEPLLAFGRTSSGIPFGGGRTLTDVFFLLCSTDDAGHLRILARLSRLIADADFLPKVRAADDARTLLAVLQDFEQQLDDEAR